MIELLPLRERRVLGDLNEKENVNASLAYCLYDKGEMAGYLLYSLERDYARLLAYSAGSDAELDGLVRSVLASAYDIGIDKASFSDRFDLDMLRKYKVLKQNQAEVESIHALLYEAGCDINRCGINRCGNTCDGCGCGCE